MRPTAPASFPPLFALSALVLLVSLSACSVENENAKKQESTTKVTTTTALQPTSTAAVSTGAKTEDLQKEAVSQNPLQDQWLIVPGQSVGGIKAGSTLADLQTLFGANNVKDGKVPGPEGTTLDGAFVYPNQPDQKLMIVWKAGSKTVESIQISGKKSRWATEDGVTLGTTLETLEKLNGVPFTMSGFGWDFGGTVLSWSDTGKLRDKFSKAGSLILRLAYADDASGDATAKVSGDNPFKSNDPALQAVHPTVDSLWITLQ